MINYKEEIAKILADADIGLSFDEIKEIVEVPSDSKMGDYAFPCFKLAKVLRKAPPMIAKDIAEKITGKDLFEKIESVNCVCKYVHFQAEFYRTCSSGNCKCG